MAARAVASGVGPAIGVAIVMDGRTIYARAHGMADVSRGIRADHRTLWYLASTSKSFTGFAVALMANRGEVSFDASISRLLPNARWHPDARPDELTLARFLSHTHHLDQTVVVTSAAFTGAIPEARWPELLAHAAPTGSTDLAYNNLSYNVAAMVIDAQHPEGWRQWIEREVFRPAGIREIHPRVSGLDRRRFAMPHDLTAVETWRTLRFEKTDETMNSAGGHLATLTDLARWVIGQMDGGVIDGRRVWPAEAVQRSHRMIASHTVERSRRFAYFDRSGWSAGWDIGHYRGEPMVSRFGGYSTTRSHLSFLPGRRIGVIGESTGGLMGGVTDIIAALAYDLEAGRADARDVAAARLDSVIARLPAARRRVAEDMATRTARQNGLTRRWDDFAGRYHHDGLGEIRFSPAGEGLRFRWGVLEGPVEIFDGPENKLRFEVVGNGRVASFRFEGTGPAVAMALEDGSAFTRR